jgi:1,4-dihydroxy-2-naphthoate octaprenyltransferase
MPSFKSWFFQIRGPFLILSVVLVLIGMAAAWQEGIFHLGHSLLLLLGVLLTQISVNLFNELSDYQTKIDTMTERTPFSGGSGLLQSGESSPESVRIAAYAALLISAGIGLYFCFISGWLILVFMILGAFTIRFYTTHLARWLLGEFAAGLALGTFVVLGVTYALTHELNGSVIWISIPPGILTFLLLLLNEFPDAEADEKGGRHHLIIRFGKEMASQIYVAGLLLVYLWIFLGPLFFNLPWTVLFSFLTLPLAVRAGRIALKHHSETTKLIPALGMNVGVVILTDLLLAVGLFVS